jgi:hypothetical protein
LTPQTATLPILKSATIQISAEEGAKVTLNLLSDGSPTSQVFKIRPLTAEALTDGTHSDVLNPSLYDATRVAANYDFRVCLSGYTYFVQDVKIQVEVDTETHYVLAGNDGSTSDGSPIPSPNPYNFGTQYPLISASSIKISGGGKALVILDDKNNDGEYTWNADPSVSESINVVLDGQSSELTLQSPGKSITSDKPFSLEVYDGINEVWVSLFRLQDASTDLFDMSKSLTTKTDFTITPSEITVDFDFKCYVI